MMLNIPEGVKIEPIDYIFQSMAALYGAAWDKSLGAAPMNDVKSAWSHVLEFQLTNPAGKRSVLWALDNLPERPPNAPQFRALCRQAPAPEAPRLEAPRADPQRVAAELAKLAATQAAPRTPRTDGREWARAILARHEGGERFTQTVLTFARQGLGMQPEHA